MALVRLQQARTYEAEVIGHALPEVDATAAEAGTTGAHSRQHDSARKPLRQERYGVITAVISDVVRGYVDLRGAQLQLGILNQASDVLRPSLSIVSQRYERGITNELDVALATRELDSFTSEIAPAEAQVKAAQYTLAVLLGVYPESMADELAAPGMIPSLPGSIAAGAPLDLLKRRPDIQQAERELAANTARIGVATAQLFPQVALVGSLGAQQGQIPGTSQQVGKHLWSFGSGAVWPVLDFGAIDAEVDIADLEARASLANYRERILAAVREVDGAIDSFSAQQARVQNLHQALAAAQRAVDLATARYNRGLTDYLNVVDAERQFYEIEHQDVTAQTSAGEEFVLLYRSLGGGWQNYQSVPGIRQPQPAVIAAFRRLLMSERASPAATSAPTANTPVNPAADAH